MTDMAMNMKLLPSHECPACQRRKPPAAFDLSREGRSVCCTDCRLTNPKLVKAIRRAVTTRRTATKRRFYERVQRLA